MFIIKNSQVYVLQFGEYAPGCFYVILSETLQPIDERVVPDIIYDCLFHLCVNRSVSGKLCKDCSLKLWNCHGFWRLASVNCDGFWIDWCASGSSGRNFLVGIFYLIDGSGILLSIGCDFFSICRFCSSHIF